MNQGQEEYHILKVLVYTFCISIFIGLIGVSFGKVDAQFVEGLITGGLLTLITNVFKDLSAKDIPTTTQVKEGKANVQNDSISINGVGPGDISKQG